MIIKDDKTAIVSSSGALKKVVDYHLEKISEGEAKYIESSGLKLEDILKEGYEYIRELPQNRNKPVLHIPISLSVGDELSKEDLSYLIHQYLDLKGLSFKDYSLVQHFDKPYNHYHLIVLNRDLEGKYNNNFTKMGAIRDTISFCRDMEKRLGLKVVNGKGMERKNYNEIQALKYSLYNSIKKHEEKYREGFKSLGSVFNKILSSSKGLTNQQIKGMISEHYYVLMGFGKKNGLMYVSRKDRLERMIAKEFDKISANPFIYEHPELYVRVIKNKYIRYGLKSEGFYVNENDLPINFSLQHIRGEVRGTDKRYEKQRIKDHLGRLLKGERVSSIGKLTEELSKVGIEVVEHSNRGGVYGISFRSGGEEFKASEISREYSYSRLLRMIKTNEQKRGISKVGNIDSKGNLILSTGVISGEGYAKGENNAGMNSEIDEIEEEAENGKKKGI